MAAQDLARGEFPSPDPQVVVPGRMTEEEFVAWCDEDTRAEWVDGEVVMMSPSNGEHNDVQTYLTMLVRAFVDKDDLGRVFSDVQIRFEEQRRRRVPDLWFVQKSRLGLFQWAHLEGPPDLAVEVISPDSVARDWREKYLEYEAAGVREYWVIDPAQRHAEFYALVSQPEQASAEPARRFHRLPEQEGAITSTVLPNFRLPVAWLWLETRPNVVDALRQLGIFPS
jgi:Uma2 family endonuclease